MEPIILTEKRESVNGVGGGPPALLVRGRSGFSKATWGLTPEVARPLAGSPAPSRLKARLRQQGGPPSPRVGGGAGGGGYPLGLKLRKFPGFPPCEGGMEGGLKAAPHPAEPPLNPLLRQEGRGRLRSPGLKWMPRGGCQASPDRLGEDERIPLAGTFSPIPRRSPRAPIGRSGRGPR